MKLKILVLSLGFVGSFSFAQIDRLAKQENSYTNSQSITEPRPQEIKECADRIANGGLWSGDINEIVKGASHGVAIDSKREGKIEERFAILEYEGFYKTKLLMKGGVGRYVKDRLMSGPEMAIFRKEVLQRIKNNAINKEENYKINQAGPIKANLLKDLSKAYCFCEGSGIEVEAMREGRDKLLNSKAIKVLESNGDIRSIKRSDFKCDSPSV